MASIRPCGGALVGGAAWAVPAVVAVHPAASLAASLCSPITLNWNNQTTGSTFSSTTLGTTLGTTTVTESLTSTVYTASNNNVVTYATAGGYTGNRLRFAFDHTKGATETVTFTFSQPVIGLTFTFYNIDASSANNFSDRIEMQTSGYTWTQPSGGQVAFDSATNSFYNPTDGVLASTSNLGNVTVDYGSTWLTSMTFRYYQGRYVSANPNTDVFVGLSNLTFTPQNC